jgi:hypothetical protein
MRTAAGVLLIVAAVINLFAGLGYLGGGAMVGGMGKLSEMAIEESKKQGHELSDEQKAQFAQMNEARKNPAVGSAVRVMMAYGLFLLVTVGTSITGAVFLFKRKRVKVIVVMAALALVAELIGCVAAGVMVGGGVMITKLVVSAFGLIGGILALVAARQISAANAPEAAPPPLAAPTSAPTST